MYLFFDPAVLPVTTTDIDGNVLYIRTNGLVHYGYPDLIVSGECGESGEQLLLDILERIFKLDFNINSQWNYNGRLFKLLLDEDGLAHIEFIHTKEAKLITILNPITGEPAKHFSKGLSDLFGHPEAEVLGDVVNGREILAYVIDQVREGLIYDQDTMITYEGHEYYIRNSMDRLGSPLIEIQCNQKDMSLSVPVEKTHRKKSYLKRVK
ncbi:hypothetical protein [Paenibacillus sp. MMO-177]|uniref:hypothetical protein n=1 Tax=Paenibacillus sp. MMO-177 TaxID=3081289 RepID=UPI003017DBBA